ncbi:MAG: hypothetical protein GYA50_04905 [Eubacteriaceae bacterium]|nr:hypothetical protein [Eubacteriaceae bacterium]
MKKRLIYILAALIILSGGFALGFGYNSISNNQANSGVNNNDNTNDDVSVSGSTLGSGCIVEYITNYEANNQSVKTQENLNANLVGKNKGEIEQYYKKWKLDYFSENKITLSRTVPGYPKGYAVVKVMLNEEDLSTGKTIVYEYDGEGEMLLKDTIDDVPQLLQANELKELMDGKVFTSLNDAYAYLENILE